MSALKEGYTTGACAAAAAKAAVMVLCGEAAPEVVEIPMPDGKRVTFPVQSIQSSENACEVAIRKHAGDDPDITDRLCVAAQVRFTEGHEVTFEAGEGVGVITKPGLSLPPGEPAINPGPRSMIRSAIAEVSGRGVHVRISIPGGNELAGRTFNPRLGIVGGLSILGTTGKERPYSVPALEESLKCALAVAAACGVTAPVLVPGNIGERAARKNFRLGAEQVVQVSNLWGFMLEETARYPFGRVLVLGHPGKLAKLINGEWNTHSGKSGSAVPIVKRLGEKIMGNPIPESQTVEGIFQALPEPECRDLAQALCSRIVSSVAKKLDPKQMAAAAIINMKGDLLGSAGDLSSWQ
jgi:cobalt-precorrin-5B (C1)-methyltransferase